MFETPNKTLSNEDTRQEDQAQKICEGLEDLSIELRGWQFTEEQWQAIRLAWVDFAETFAPTREPQKAASVITKFHKTQNKEGEGKIKVEGEVYNPLSEPTNVHGPIHRVKYDHDSSVLREVSEDDDYDRTMKELFE